MSALRNVFKQQHDSDLCLWNAFHGIKFFTTRGTIEKQRLKAIKELKVEAAAEQKRLETRRKERDAKKKKNESPL